MTSYRGGLQPTRLLCPWNFPSKNTGVGCHVLLQGIFPTQGLNLGLLHCRWILYGLSHQGRWRIIYLSTHTRVRAHTHTYTHTHPTGSAFPFHSLLQGIFPFSGPPEPTAAAAPAAGKSLQWCPTLCNPIDGSPPGSPVPGIPQASMLEWVNQHKRISNSRCVRLMQGIFLIMPKIQ